MPYRKLYAMILGVQKPRHVQRVEVNAKDVKADAKFPLLAHEPPGKEVHPDVGLSVETHNLSEPHLSPL